MPARYRIFTPSGFMVSGMSNASECELWDRYGRIMGKSREQLEKQGYSAVLMDRGRVITAPSASGVRGGKVTP